MNFRISKFALGRTACLIALLGTGTSLSYAQDGCSNPPPNVEATPGPTPTLAPPVWDAGLGIGVVADSDGTQATTSGPPPEGGQPLFDGRMTAPEDQTDDEADPAKVQVGKRLSCAVEDASDSDHWSQDDGQPCKTDPDGIDDDGVHYTWTASGGSFEGPLDNEGHETFVSSVQGQGAKWVAPTTPGKYTISCTIDDTPTAVVAPETGSRDDGAITRSCVVTVYGLSIQFVDTEVAAGAIDNDAHRARFDVMAYDNIGPISSVKVDLPEILNIAGSVGQLGGGTDITAKIIGWEDGDITDENGKVRGIFQSGSRTSDATNSVTTPVGYKRDNSVVSSAAIKQVWNSENEPWTYDPYFYYDLPSNVVFNMSYSRGPITGHSMFFENTTVSGWEWIPQSYDWDEDGILDDAYWPQVYSEEDEDPSGWDTYQDLSEWSEVSEVGEGEYQAAQTVWWNEDFIIDDVWFRIVDEDVFDAEGAS